MGGFWKSPVHLRILAKCVPAQGGCVIWTGTKTAAGYGRARDQGRPQYAHRIVYTALIGPIPDGLVIDHLCRVHACVNPLHLEAVTHAENVRRGIGGWNSRAKTHCPASHEYTEENTYRDSRGRRRCRTCLVARRRAYGERKSA